MAFVYTVKKGCEFRLDGKRFVTGDRIEGDLVAKLEADAHLVGLCIRANAEEPAPVPPSVVKASEKPVAPPAPAG